VSGVSRQLEKIRTSNVTKDELNVFYSKLSIFMHLEEAFNSRFLVDRNFPEKEFALKSAYDFQKAKMGKHIDMANEQINCLIKLKK
jgi:hypothetical protein